MRLSFGSRGMLWVGRKGSKPVTYDDLVDAETRCLEAEERLCKQREALEAIATRSRGRPGNPADFPNDSWQRLLITGSFQEIARAALDSAKGGDRPMPWLGLMGPMPGDWVCRFCRSINGRGIGAPVRSASAFRHESEER